MEINALKNADYLDIVFDNRNKNYGGYQLRKYYNQRVGKAVAILYGALAIAVLYGFLHKQDARAAVSPVFDANMLTDVNITPPPPPPAPPIPPPPPPPAPPAHARPTSIFTKPEITDAEVPDDKQMAHAADLVNSHSGLTNSNNGDVGIEPPDVRPNTTTVIAPPSDKKPDKAVIWVEQMPSFNGDIMTYLAAHIHYPEAARDAGVEGRVVVCFIVNEDGKISDARIVKGIGGGCDEEALRVVNAMPAWKAGKQNGRPVKVYFNLPIVFQLQ